MSYTLSVPLMNVSFARGERQKTLDELRRVGAKRVFLALQANSLLSDQRAPELNALRENCRVLHAEGYEVGAWLWAFYLSVPNDYTYIVSPDGRTAKFTVCPLDADYRTAMGRFLQDIADCGVDLIQFDDDYRFGFQDNGFGCVCAGHRREIGRRLGRAVTDEELRTCLLSGGGNPVRDAFTDANGASLELFAEDMRRYVDEVAPHVRMGYCSCIGSWDLDGAVPDIISRKLAGRTRPFYRLIGAPYWAAMNAWGNKLGDVIDLERAECARRKDKETEIFSEGDTFPRPRYSTPASYLECFDTALRAAGCTDGILKYMLDYTADADYETGYADAAVRDAAAYAAIDEIFGGKACQGVRVYENPHKYRTLPIPPHMEGSTAVQDVAFPAAARFVTALSLPAVFEGEGVCGVAFGEDARTLPETALKNGLILDADAAVLLQERGVDVGILSRGEALPAGTETFADGRRVSFGGEPYFYPLALCAGAEIQSETTVDGKTYPLSYVYQNAAGQRFLVYAYQSVFRAQTWFRCYLRQGQVKAFTRRCGNTLPAYCPGNPEAYLLVKTDGNKTAVGVWNLFADPIYGAEVELPFAAAVTRAFGPVGCSGNVLKLGNIPAFGFHFAEVERTTSVEC